MRCRWGRDAGNELLEKIKVEKEQLIKEGKRVLRVVNDKLGSPTFTKDFAGNLMNVVKTEKYGLYHMTNKGTCSRFDIAVKIVDYLGLQNEVKIDPINSDQYPLPAPRADSEMENFLAIRKSLFLAYSSRSFC